MFRRATAAATGAALTLGAAAAVALTPSAAHAADSFTGYVQVIKSGEVVGCVSDVNSGHYAGHRTTTSSAYVVTASPGTQQELAIADSTRFLGLDESSAAYAMQQGQAGYTFLNAVDHVPAGSPSVNWQQSAVWTVDATTRELTATYVWPDNTSVELESWDFSDGQIVGATDSISAVNAAYPFTLRAVTYRIGDTCSGSVDAAQAITFTSMIPSPAYPGQTYAITATGGESGNDVTFTSATGEICSVDGATVTFEAVGTCTIEADQAAGTGYQAAPTARQDIIVSAIPSTVTVTPALSALVTGQTTTATAQVSVERGSVYAAGGSVQFALDGDDLGDPVEINADGEATSLAFAGHPGSHVVTATYVPSAATYAGQSGQTTVTIDKADTATNLSVTASTLSATVSPIAPSAGDPTGQMTFLVDGHEVGQVQVHEGTAELTYTVPTDTNHVVAVQYGGDDDFNASSTSTSRSNPTITARLTSSKAPRKGWYRQPVKVTFTCEADGAPLATPCPAPTTLTRSGSVTRTVRTIDGGIATVTASARIDTAAPKVRVTGMKAGRTYFDAPKPKCVAKDSQSGVKKCRISSKRKGSKVVVTATATDVAGNTSTKRVSYRVAGFTILGAKKVGGTWQVTQGRTYTLVVRGSKARYVYATPAPGRPSRGSVAFHKAGKDRWALGVTMSMATSHTRTWNLGYTQNGTLHVARVHVKG